MLVFVLILSVLMLFFGLAWCSYRRFHFKVEKRRVLCPICDNEMVRVRYVGVVGLIILMHQCFVTNRCSPLFKREFLYDLVDSGGRSLWVEDSVKLWWWAS